MPHYYVDNSVLEHFGVKGSALKGFAKAGVLGVAAVKSPKFREKMNKVWDNAVKSPKFREKMNKVWDNADPMDRQTERERE